MTGPESVTMARKTPYSDCSDLGHMPTMEGGTHPQPRLHPTLTILMESGGEVVSQKEMLMLLPEGRMLISRQK